MSGATFSLERIQFGMLVDELRRLDPKNPVLARALSLSSALNHPLTKETPMNNHLDRDLRMECLRLALLKTNGAIDTVRLADSFYKFAIGETMVTTRERIDAALDAADVK